MPYKSVKVTKNQSLFILEHDKLLKFGKLSRIEGFTVCILEPLFPDFVAIVNIECSFPFLRILMKTVFYIGVTHVM